MVKFCQLMTVGVGEKSVTFTGREPFSVDDEDLKKGLLALGVFEVLEDGALRYNGRVTVPMADGSERLVDPNGFIAAQKADLKNPDTTSFR